MGRSLETANQLVLNEQRAFTGFRRALRAPQQLAFDELFAAARRQTAAIGMAAEALPFESILLAMLVEEHARVELLGQQVEALQRALERLRHNSV